MEKATINDFNGDAVKLYEVLANRCWIDIDIVKKNIPIKNFYSIIEFYENEDIVEIERILDTKIKK